MISTNKLSLSKYKLYTFQCEIYCSSNSYHLVLLNQNNNEYYLTNRHQDVDIDLAKHERTLQRVKRGILPNNPKSVDEINAAFANPAVMKSYGQTLHKEKEYKFFRGAVATEGYSFCVFSSEATQLLMKEIEGSDRHILMDATFRTCPVGPFKQLLILYIRKRKKVCIIFL